MDHMESFTVSHDYGVALHEGLRDSTLIQRLRFMRPVFPEKVTVPSETRSFPFFFLSSHYLS